MNHRHRARAGGQIITVAAERWRRYINEESRVVTIMLAIVRWGRRVETIKPERVVVLTKERGRRVRNPWGGPPPHG